MHIHEHTYVRTQAHPCVCIINLVKPIGKWASGAATGKQFQPCHHSISRVQLRTGNHKIQPILIDSRSQYATIQCVHKYYIYEHLKKTHEQRSLSIEWKPSIENVQSGLFQQRFFTRKQFKFSIMFIRRMKQISRSSISYK